MTIKQLIEETKPLRIVGNDNLEVTGIEIDSRRIGPGNAFIAMKGTQVDGHQFIPKALELGATCIICETLPAEPQEGVTFVQYESTESIAGALATHFYGDPTKRMKLIGVTGTNGKTTIATLLYTMFRQFGYKVGLCSTVCNYIDGRPIPTECTTPDPITLNRLLGQMADEGCQYAFMEVSSHAVVQHRIGGLTFAGGLFTNLTRDHLDYHKTFEAYRDAKKGFFDMLPQGAFAITNADDKNGMFMVQNTQATVRTYAQRTSADFKARILEEGFEGMNLNIDGREVFVQFVGRFNVSNLLAVYGAAVMMGKDPEEVLIALSTMKPVNGRFEAIRSREGVTAIVDYAHTPDALVNVLSTINEVLQKKGQCWTVCGAGGNRDKGKRPLMAQEAVRNSDRVIITSDNPRFEEPQDIINDMLAGLTDEERRTVLTIVDRREAIRTACMLAKPGDVVLVAGKGHEDYQIIQGVKHHFDDHEVIRECFGIS
ncbi:MAG: UDP-N-acetylmuramoyl-L-alanyl-D-glutamate--2,6-diaminopimelate ligase [Bacteroidaceae bacterium]|nr:UDP-N-acetylmuramoyl-L-alanyl-D-glutamate--2,6-diaminopimelate ligase [Bacteroidaceae bacterium]